MFGEKLPVRVPTYFRLSVNGSTHTKDIARIRFKESAICFYLLIVELLQKSEFSDTK
ncbi:hypothetical protein LEP1GSC049_2383 [Leptospira kirschneri serovar Cynopteri str. 3522 CT]|nr:hypothetical protein LEP1GSC049_2383 [Leptospira kirschneri serovar Cynopteri str. 3522 CT]